MTDIQILYQIRNNKRKYSVNLNKILKKMDKLSEFQHANQKIKINNLSTMQIKLKKEH
jgi:hypothetical protein